MLDLFPRILKRLPLTPVDVVFNVVTRLAKAVEQDFPVRVGKLNGVDER